MFGEKTQAQLPGGGKGGLITPLARAGKVYRFRVTPNPFAGGFVPPPPVTVVGNAFYVLDSPFPVQISTSQSGTTAYPPQTGESLPQQIQTLTVNGINTGFAGNPNANLNQGLPLGVTYTIKIWVGSDSHIGFIDHRTLASQDDFQVILPDSTGSSPYALGAGTGINITPLITQVPATIIGAYLTVLGPAGSAIEVCQTSAYNNPTMYVQFGSPPFLVYPIWNIFNPASGGQFFLFNPTAGIVNFTWSYLVRLQGAILEDSSF